MMTYTDNDKLLIHYFQDSLSGASLEWYMQLERCHVQSLRDLAKAFLKHYQYSADLAPNWTQLEDMAQKNNDSFIEYDQRQRELAARVHPSLLGKELIDMFMGTLQVKYIENMVERKFV